MASSDVRCIWLTGAPAAGKSTIAAALRDALQARGQRAVLYDGDVLRASVSRDLGFDDAARIEQARRAARLASEVLDAGAWAIVALVSPSDEAREAALRVLGDRMVLVHVDASLSTRRRRDPKGLYRLAAAGELSDLTGYDAPYVAPAHPHLVVRTDREPVTSSLGQVLSILDRPRGTA